VRPLTVASNTVWEHKTQIIFEAWNATITAPLQKCWNLETT